MDNIIKHRLLLCYQSYDFVVVSLIRLKSMSLIMILITIHVFGQIPFKNAVVFFNLTPAIVGFYAMASTVLDYENDTSTALLSCVPIQFIFNVCASNTTCTLPPIYIGDVPADQFIFVKPDDLLAILIRIKVQCH